MKAGAVITKLFSSLELITQGRGPGVGERSWRGWAVTVITNLFSSLDSIVQGLGTGVVEWLWGGYAVTGVTLNRFYSLHYLLPFVIAGLVGLHLWALHLVGQNSPP